MYSQRVLFGNHQTVGEIKSQEKTPRVQDEIYTREETRVPPECLRFPLSAGGTPKAATGRNPMVGFHVFRAWRRSKENFGLFRLS
jgi:hypothetical protein